MKDRAILIVDDDKIIRESLCEFLSLEGYAAEGAESLKQALARLKTQSFPLVIAEEPALVCVQDQKLGRKGSRLRFSTAQVPCWPWPYEFQSDCVRLVSVVPDERRAAIADFQDCHLA